MSRGDISKSCSGAETIERGSLSIIEWICGNGKDDNISMNETEKFVLPEKLQYVHSGKSENTEMQTDFKMCRHDMKTWFHRFLIRL